MMDSHVEWAERGLQRAKELVEKLQKELNQAQQDVRSWAETLRLAKEEDGEESKEKVVATIMYESSPKRRARKVIDAIEGILADGKPRSAVRLQKMLDRKGITTTPNSINTSLNRFRGILFERNEDKLWFLMESPDRLSTEDHEEDNAD